MKNLKIWIKEAKEAVKKIIKKHQNKWKIYIYISKKFSNKIMAKFCEFLRLEKEEQRLVKFQRFNKANVIKKKEKQKKIDY